MKVSTFNKNLVINWHLLEQCQFKCKYCYAEWSKPKLREVYKQESDSCRLIEQIAELRRPDQKVRISFAGGEPLLDKRLSAKIEYARQQHLAVSLITNGQLLSKGFVHGNSRKIDMLGISIDSLQDATNLKIGRATLTGQLADHQQIMAFLSLARQYNPKIRIKINTVVNQHNYDEDLSRLIERIDPDKWKVLRVLPTTTKSARQAISDEQFAVFQKRHASIPCAVFEDNDCMENSYLMIDPYGRFFFNKPGGQYGYSEPILDVGIEKALAQTDFDREKFEKRYSVEVQ